MTPARHWPSIVFDVELMLSSCCLATRHPRVPDSHTTWLPNVALMLDQRPRRWPSIKLTLGESILFTGPIVCQININERMIAH